ncbi:MAG: hypothetical protein HXY37_15030 [Chloroflexi bacterium]|nr:hypothetical protein [Chloroflexota bacterium]
MSQARQAPVPGPDIERLLVMATDLARGGNPGGARTLFLALTREHPQDPRPWLGLAAATASTDERRQALERALALDPANQQAHQALQRLVARDAATIAALAPPDAAAAPAPRALPVAAEEDAEPERNPFPLLNLIMAGIIVLLLAALGFVIGRALLAGNQTIAAPTAPARPTTRPAASAPPLAPPSPLPTATTPPTPLPPTAVPTSAAVAVVVPTVPELAPSPTLPPASPTAPIPLPLGTVVDYDGWSATLLRPDYAVTLDGAIGDLRPAGRFVLAVVAVSNNGPTPRVIPPELFVLRDSAGRSYSPVPGASSAYLALYQRAQRGDLALEDSFAPGSGMRSVPLLFDVPPDASGLQLLVPGAGPTGWPVGTSEIPSGTGP